MNTINQPRKIRVTGCANCPYNDATEEDENGIIYHCTHYSFNRKRPVIDRVYIDNIYVEQSMIHSEYFPDWCPLDFDNSIIIHSTCNI